jgi:cytochrome c oxidase cbb3-type subunit III
MDRKYKVALVSAVVFCVDLGTALPQAAQTPAPAITQAGPQAAPAGFGSAYPPRPPADPVLVARGKASFGVRCAFCHGSDARGGESGPNLLHSEMVLTDQAGENIIPVVQHGRPQLGMPAFDISVPQIEEIVAYLHSLPVSGNDRGRMAPIRIPVGDAAAGKQQFDTKCGSCHTSASLRGIATRVSDPRMLQQTWLLPGGRGGAQDVKIPAKRVTVVYQSGKKLSGQLQRIDDFLVRLVTDTGETVTVPRHGATPKVTLEDPLAGHTKLLPVYTDENIHDITAYLETLK